MVGYGFAAVARAGWSAVGLEVDVDGVRLVAVWVGDVWVDVELQLVCAWDDVGGNCDCRTKADERDGTEGGEIDEFHLDYVVIGLCC